MTSLTIPFPLTEMRRADRNQLHVSSRVAGSGHSFPAFFAKISGRRIAVRRSHARRAVCGHLFPSQNISVQHPEKSLGRVCVGLVRPFVFVRFLHGNHHDGRMNAACAEKVSIRSAKS